MIVNLNGRNVKIAEMKEFKTPVLLDSPAIVIDEKDRMIRTSNVKKTSYDPKTNSLSILTASGSVYTNDPKILELARKVEQQEIDNFQKYRDSLKETIDGHTIKQVDISSIEIGKRAILTDLNGDAKITSPVKSFCSCENMLMMTTESGSFYSTEKDLVEKHWQKMYRDFPIQEAQDSQNLANMLNDRFGLKRERDEIEKIDSQEFEFDR